MTHGSGRRRSEASTEGTGNDDALGRAAKAAVATSAAVQLGAVVVVLLLGVVLGDGTVGDRLRAVPLAAVYGLPGVLALLALRRRPPLLLAAGTTTLVLAVFPFSLHSFVFGPVGLVYLIAYTRWPAPQRAKQSAAAGAVVPLLLLAGFVALVWHEDPTCYTKHRSGEITLDRDPGSTMSGAKTIEAGAGIVEQGCSSDSVVWWEAMTSLALSGAALAAALYLSDPSPRDRGDARP